MTFWKDEDELIPQISRRGIDPQITQIKNQGRLKTDSFLIFLFLICVICVICGSIRSS